MSEENENEEGQEEEEEEEDAPPSGPISGALPSIPDIVKMVGLCDCIKAPEELCCPPAEHPGNSKEGGEPPPPGDPTPVGMCKLIEANISMAFGPQLSFALAFEVVLDIPPGVPIPPIPMPDLAMKLFGIPTIDVPGFDIPFPPDFGLKMPGLDIPGFFPEPLSLDLPPFPGLPFFGIVLWPINFAIGLFKLDIKIPIPTPDPCDLIEAVGLKCPPIPGLPQLNIALCLLKIILLLLAILVPLLAILIGMGIKSIDEEGKMLDENGEEVVVPPPLIVENPEDNREEVPTHTKVEDDGTETEVVDPGVKVNEFNTNVPVTIVAKKYDLKKAFSNNSFAAGPENVSDVYEEVTRANSDGEEEVVKVRAGAIEGDENEDGTPGEEEPNMTYVWKIYAPEELDETDVIAYIKSMGILVEDEKDENGVLIPGGLKAGTFKPKTLEERTPIYEITKTESRDGADARKITFSFPKIGNYQVICDAKKTSGSREIQRLQTIINIGEPDFDSVWRTNKRPTELPDVLKEMRMPDYLSKIKATEFPIQEFPSPVSLAKKVPAPVPEVTLPQPTEPKKPQEQLKPGKKEETGV